ncbi:MAG: hypothetical protein JXA18_07375 [Chitinispirillaceae bacterium]|nr:hypothetical protein [Chitinispirillaceae bacterium]
MAGKLLWPVVLQLLGIVVIIAEFILPSMGLLSVTAIGLFGYSLFLVFSKVSPMAGMTFVIVDVCLIPLLVIAGIKLLAASPVTLRASLDAKNGATTQPSEWASLVGASGSAATDLHPAGAALINGKRFDVVSRGDFIPKGSAVTVASVEGNRIVVEQGEMAGGEA